MTKTEFGLLKKFVPKKQALIFIEHFTTYWISAQIIIFNGQTLFLPTLHFPNNFHSSYNARITLTNAVKHELPYLNHFIHSS